MANYINDFGNEETAREAAELCGGTELIGQMSWHLKQVAKHFYWWGVLKNALSICGREFILCSVRCCLTGRDFTRKKVRLWYIWPGHHGYDKIYFYYNLVNVLVRFNQLLWYDRKMTSTVKHTWKCQEIKRLTEKLWRRGWAVLEEQCEMEELHFTRFAKTIY